MAVPFSNTRLRVPKGFQNVLEGLAREVLRCQPENIYSFAADYFEELLRKREETGYDDITLLGAKLEDRFYNNHSFKNPNTNTNNEEQQSAAVKIQSEYRRFAAKKDYDSKKEEEAAIVIQASVRGHLERQTHKLDSNDEMNNIPITEQTNHHSQHELKEDSMEIKTTVEKDFEISKENESDNHQILQDENQNNQENNLEDTQNLIEESTIVTEENVEKPNESQNIEEIIDIDLNDPDVEKAAVKIQSVYKGFRTRKNIEDIQTTEDIRHHNTEDDNLESKALPKLKEDEVIDIDLNDPEVEKAAVKIQSAFKGFRTRKTTEETQTTDNNRQQDGEDEIIEKSNEIQEVCEEEVIDIDLNDPDVEKAAVKIQSVYKGFKSRKTVKKIDEEENLEVDELSNNTKKNDELIENQEFENDEITNVTDNLPNETENTADQDVDESQTDLGVKSQDDDGIDGEQKTDSGDMKESMDFIKTENDEVFNNVEEVSENQNEDLLDTDKMNEKSLVKDDQVNNDEFNEEHETEDLKEEEEAVIESSNHEEQDNVMQEDNESIVETHRSLEDGVDNENNQEKNIEVHEENESVLETNRSLDDVVQMENQQENEIHEENESFMETNRSLEDAGEIENQQINENDLEEGNENVTTEMEAQDASISINNNVNVDENEVNEEETLKEIVDTERTVDVTNDLEDSTVDHQESNQVISNPDNENNQEAETVDDSNNVETGRTETDD